MHGYTPLTNPHPPPLPLPQAIATLVNIASLDRPEEKIKGLPRIVAESIGRDINDVYRGANMGDVSPSIYVLFVYICVYM